MNHENVNGRLSRLDNIISCVCHANRTAGEVCQLSPIRFTTRVNTPTLLFNGL